MVCWYWNSSVNVHVNDYDTNRRYQDCRQVRVFGFVSEPRSWQPAQSAHLTVLTWEDRLTQEGAQRSDDKMLHLFTVMYKCRLNRCSVIVRRLRTASVVYEHHQQPRQVCAKIPALCSCSRIAPDSNNTNKCVRESVYRAPHRVRVLFQLNYLRKLLRDVNFLRDSYTTVTLNRFIYNVVWVVAKLFAGANLSCRTITLATSCRREDNAPPGKSLLCHVSLETFYECCS